MVDKKPGMDLDHWLNNATPQGLPMKNIPSGNLEYVPPGVGSVGWFFADSYSAKLILSPPRFGSLNDEIGVRAARLK